MSSATIVPSLPRARTPAGHYKRTAVVVGSLFLVGDVAGALSLILTGSILTGPDFLTRVSASANQVILGALFVSIMGFALAMIPVVIFPVFRKYNETLALGYVVFRGALETVTYIATAACMLLLVPVSQQYLTAALPDASSNRVLGTLLLEAHDQMTLITGIVFSLGALMFYFIFYQSVLVPRWLSGWGLIGAVLYLAAGLLGILGSPMGLLMAPLALQEVALAIWLIVKGFSSSPGF